jgi:hypothetical protein
MNLVIIGNTDIVNGVCNRIVNDYNHKIICASDLIRKEEISPVLETGDITDSMVTKLVFNEISKPIKSGTFFVINEYPRTIEQAEDLERMVNIPVVIYIKKDYDGLSNTLKDFYNRKILIISGEGTPDEVYNDVIRNIIDI